MMATPLIFIAACFLLVTHISPVCQAVDLSIFNTLGSNASTGTEEKNDQFLSHILREKLFHLLEQIPNDMKIHSEVSLDQILNEILNKEASHRLRELFAYVETPAFPQGGDHDMVPAFVDHSKRADEPVNSLDLTFHLLREMIKIAKHENQWAQAEKNRKIMDAIGK